MRVLLDESLPRKLARHLVGHVVRTVPQEGWAGVKNGTLLALADAGFEAFVTPDRGLAHEQNLTRLSLRIVVIRCVSNTLEDLVPLVPAMLEALAMLPSGGLAEVG